MQRIQDLINDETFNGSIELNYAQYRRSEKRHYQDLDTIKLDGDSREVRIMGNWISKHFPEITLASPIDDEEGFNRAAIEVLGEECLNDYDKFRYGEFWRIASALSEVADFNNLFDVDHAKSIREHGVDAIKPDNLNIMMFRANRKKSWKSEARYTWERQVEVIWSSIAAVTVLNEDKKRVVLALISQLKALY
ncbi:phage protein [Vibrio ishigakensis]|uniref:Phage protein n=1 Tax=Vibrio ishigakensis TaxID=1481914 RepID=A0A0B8NWT2_9VIBR|nr:hypothetical protein [Vibrio ishigakensis]GAM56742.1 phage protein [Vibrio ishigakensis]